MLIANETLFKKIITIGEGHLVVFLDFVVHLPIKFAYFVNL